MQQLTEGGGSGAVQGRTDSHLDGFQIDATGAPLGKDSAQQVLYFARDLLMDCSTRFFPVRSTRTNRAQSAAGGRSAR
jgi:hypothetical protein